MHTLEQLRAGELCGARHLKLAENLAVFPPEILSLKETLEVLDLTGNQLSELPDALAECKKLRILFCSENNFTELPEVLGALPSAHHGGLQGQPHRDRPGRLPARQIALADPDRQCH